jgi:phosphoglycerate dehydrogenase-like enzyme
MLLPLSEIPELKPSMLGKGIEVVEGPVGRSLTEDEQIEALAGMDACFGAGRYTKRVIESNPRLKIIARVGVGYDTVDLGAANEMGVYVTNTPIPELAYAMAELTFSHILAFLKRIPQYNTEVRQGKWSSDSERGRVDDAYGLTLGVIGAGRIGGEVAFRAKAFRMNVVYHDVVRRKDLEDALGIEYVSLDELLSTSDVISIHSPLTPDTRGLIDERAIRRMKRNALVVNTARGPIVDEPALARALEENRIGGACLDVLSQEPPAEGHVFYKLGDRFPNLFLSPHSGVGTRTLRLLVRTAADEIVRVCNGERPKYPVNNPSRTES